ncbi:hypothetical protein LP7551_02224 [Roseibium album]|nr:hypothetical protein LP7551_02224 [Roseibium album]
MRVASYQAQVRNFAVIVSEPLAVGKGLLLMREDSLGGKTTEFKGKKIAVGLGVVWDKQVLPSGSIPVLVEDYRSGLIMLRSGRIAALMIDNRNYGLLEEEFRQDLIVKEVVNLSGHLCLHNRNRGLIDHFDKAIKAWKAERATGGGS